MKNKSIKSSKTTQSSKLSHNPKNQKQQRSSNSSRVLNAEHSAQADRINSGAPKTEAKRRLLGYADGVNSGNSGAPNAIIDRGWGFIRVFGAREHNLKNVDVAIPKNKLTVITGPSGSGKSSLALDILFTEGKRRYMESLSAYARQFLGVSKKPDVERIEGLCPSIAIEQKTVGSNPRSTVGTITEIFDYLRVLYARIGIIHCAECKQVITAQSPETIIALIYEKFIGQFMTIAAPIAHEKKGEFINELVALFNQGFYRFQIDGASYKFSSIQDIHQLKLKKTFKHTIDLLIDAVEVIDDERSRVQEALEKAFAIGKGTCKIIVGDQSFRYSSSQICIDCGASVPELEPRLFSFNSPIGACSQCHGLGVIHAWPWQENDPDAWKSEYPEFFSNRYAQESTCHVCHGKRLNQHALHVLISAPENLGFEVRDESSDFSKPILGNEYPFKNSFRAPSVFAKASPDRQMPLARHSSKSDGWEQREADGISFVPKTPSSPSFAGQANKISSRVPKSEYTTQDLGIRLLGYNIFDVGNLSIKHLIAFIKNLSLTPMHKEIAQPLITEILNRLTFLYDVGLSYLTLNRTARTLSGGEGQRIRLATQIGSALSGVLYILDEPSIGLHQRDNDRLIDTLKKLRDQGNTVVVVEHDMDTMMHADYLIDMGPGAGILGGTVTAVGTPQELAKNPQSLTGAYLSGKRIIAVPQKVRKPQAFMTLKHATKNNLKDVTVKFPLGVLCGISGVSGSGKSTLIMQELVPALFAELGGYARKHKPKIGAVKPTSSDLEGAESIENLVVIDQSPIGRTPRSNPATYLGIFDEIRKIFASLPESNARGYTVGRFSFNVADGRCYSCKGDGTVTIEMHFLPAVTMVCKVCRGKRYNHETLQVLYKGKSIADVLALSVREAVEFFGAHQSIVKRLQLLCDVGLEYLTLGQPSTTLSGGEAQRIKLVDELAKRGSSTLYILDEPTTGLHTNDIERLLIVLNRLIDKGNSIIVIEHNLDLLKTADYIIDMGPEGGDEGGVVVATGTPDEIASSTKSYTGRYLNKIL